MTIIAVTVLLTAVDPCPGSTTRQVEACLATDFARADAELNRYYSAAVKRVAGERREVALAQLRASERAWIRYRDAECGAVYEWWSMGTVRGTFATQCRLRLTWDRTKDIWRNWLTYADGTPPLLPEPTSRL